MWYYIIVFCVKEVKTLVGIQKYAVSDEVMQLAEMLQKGLITKTQFDERVVQTRQIQMIKSRMKREGKTIDFCTIASEDASGREHFTLLIAFCEL